MSLTALTSVLYIEILFCAQGFCARLSRFRDPGGGYSVNLWVGVYRWDTETLTLYKTIATIMDTIKRNNELPPPPQTNDEGAKEQKRAILESLKWGVGGMFHLFCPILYLD